MSYLKKDEQIHIENVEQLKTVYEVFKREWHKAFSLDEEIEYFSNEIWCYFVGWDDGVIALVEKDDNLTTITYDDFISQIEKPPIPIPTIIKSIDGKKYKVIVVEEIIIISTEDAKNRANRLAKENGLLVGISSGANILAAELFLQKNKDIEGDIITILCDRGERYLSCL